MSIELSDSERGRAAEQAARAGFPTVEAYLEALVRSDRARAGDWLDRHAPDAPEAERARLRERLRVRVVALLDEAVASGPATPTTAADWDDIRAEVARRRLGRARVTEEL